MIDTTYEAAKQDQQLAHAAPRLTHPTPCTEMPAYMTEVYDWAYVDPAWVRWLDHNLVVKTLLFCNDQRLMRRYLERIRPGMRVWQVAHVYGDLVQRAAQRTGPEGCFHLTDVTPIQIAHGRSKLDAMPWTRVIRQDAALHIAEPGETYDLICNFMLLHEVPDDWKRRIVDNMLAQMPAHGEVLFVDYHGPARWQPVRYILKLVNRLLEPFAHALWENEISHFASQPERYEWSKETLFGGVYQVVSVKHKTTR
ncbi:rhodoquinone biosynthesis methyltransferase RquA [Uliginosibacterium sp. 31-16]|uniref:rhodoquinone biosynthesis methyltransferase RquA n=1 Tax=Uliginosibacterium sp. 31-16 TaxID=3068315 RepID=UPI00273F2DD7|nr:rhodoquinone biosynthesis methyltransferase RquA [Uliginosibacterium sp. 31-16]MDP5239962.1 rhodoquinone biosynthesis methyltransferase RquA [Uliginosibacterium sp. 31-16]